MSTSTPVRGTCPMHGSQVFAYVAEMRWHECPHAGLFGPGSCGSVIPDEVITPDGAEVCHVSNARFDSDQNRSWR